MSDRPIQDAAAAVARASQRHQHNPTDLSAADLLAARRNLAKVKTSELIRRTLTEAPQLTADDHATILAALSEFVGAA